MGLRRRCRDLIWRLVRWLIIGEIGNRAEIRRLSLIEEARDRRKALADTESVAPGGNP